METYNKFVSLFDFTITPSPIKNKSLFNTKGFTLK